MRVSLILQLISESFKVALISLWANKLRTILSLLGITIGIFAIILVYSAVDSLEHSIRSSFQSLGDNIVYVQKWPWGSEGGEYKWWTMLQRPEPSYDDYIEVKKRMTSTQDICFMYGVGKTVKSRNNNVDNATILGVSHSYNRIWELELADGRYFTESESSSGKPIVLLGHDIAEGLFGVEDPIGKKIKLMGRKVTVIGVMAKKGESLVGNDDDASIFIPALFLMKMVNPKNAQGNVVMVKAGEDVGVAKMKDELKGVMRSIRRLKPTANDDFAINEVSVFKNQLDQVFGVIGMAGTVIGLFSILVGGFGIANIMFVSVKERTGQVGIQKSLGARSSFIMWQFVFEAVTLCLIGGLFGLLLVYFGTLAISQAADFYIFLSVNNLILGIILSIIIGVVSGIYPAYQAAKMDPVVAIRYNA